MPPKIPLLYIGFAATYTMFIIWTSTTTAYDPIAHRLLSPIYPALLIILATIIQPNFWQNRYISVAVILLCFIFFTLLPVRRTCLAVSEKNKNGAGGYNTRLWQESEITGFLSLNGKKESRVIFSNAPGVVYIFSGLDAQLSPRYRFKMNSDTMTGVTITNLFEFYPSFDGAILVWYDNITRDFLFTPKELRGGCQLDIVKEFTDGTIYRISDYNN
jgi:hypothetical protein